MKKESLNSILRIGVGATFVMAAILKMLSIDEFEIYIYSFDVFNFLMTTLLSRLLITGEFIIGLFFIFKIHYKRLCEISLVILLMFTLFLVFTAVFRDDDNCHCFGEIVKLSPVESMIKNVVIACIILYIRPSSDKPLSSKRVLMPVMIVLLSLGIPFFITPMDSIYNMIYSTEENVSAIDMFDSFDDVKKIDFTNDQIIDSTAVLDLEDGKYILVYVSAGCKYCKIGVHKLSMIMKNNDLDSDRVRLFIWGPPDSVRDFMRETNTEDYSYWHIMPNKAIDITYGRFPTFVWIEDKEIVKIGSFRDLDDTFSL